MKISEHRAGVFKHMLSLLLTVVMIVSVPGLGSFAAVGSSDSSSGNATSALSPDVSEQVSESYAEGETGESMLKIDSLVEEKWTITYGDNNQLPSGGGTVPHSSVVKLTPKPGTDDLHLTFTVNDGATTTTRSLKSLVNDTTNDLEFKAVEGGIYTFVMPSKDVTISTVWELYLDEGSIELYPLGFKQPADSSETSTGEEWDGNYRILQNRDGILSTVKTNMLKLKGNLAGREISLGKLEISSNDSIELKSDNNGTAAEVELTLEGEIKAKNILVPSGAKLTINGKDEAAANPSAEGVTEDSDPRPKITLEPNADRAAIGGRNDQAGNGVIELNNVELSMTLTDGSGCSGIGPGQNNAEGSCGAVNIKDCKITVTDNGRTAASGEITRAWIGGAGVEVSMENTTLLNGDETNENSKYSSYALNGKSVTLTGCNIGITDRPNGTSGTDETNGTKNPNPIKAQIHAYEKLNIKDCFIYQ